jgi:hypothetical protein
VKNEKSIIFLVVKIFYSLDKYFLANKLLFVEYLYTIAWMLQHKEQLQMSVGFQNLFVQLTILRK